MCISDKFQGNGTDCIVFENGRKIEFKVSDQNPSLVYGGCKLEFLILYLNLRGKEPTKFQIPILELSSKRNLRPQF
jgi:hypothetical protein